MGKKNPKHQNTKNQTHQLCPEVLNKTLYVLTEWLSSEL